MMRILVISRSAWDDSDSFGNTFSNLFEGMPDTIIYNICCQDGAFNNKFVREAYQMTDKAVLRTLTGGKAGTTVKSSEIKVPQAPHVRFKHKRRPIYFIARDLIWSIGSWFDKDLIGFLQEAAPDLIYLPIYASWYMCDIQNRIIDFCNVPCVAHITDDNYNYSPAGWRQPISLFYRYVLRGKINRLIEKTSYIEVFAHTMAEEYSKYFNKPCYVIGKGIDMLIWENMETLKEPSEPYLFVYTGNIGSERYLQLTNLGHALDTLLPDKAELRIYSQTFFDKNMKEKFKSCKSIKFCGSITNTEVKAVQQNADFLVHVEGFSKQSIFETKMSFSTKIIDYMLAKRPIFAIGPSDICSIDVLRKNKLAIVACSDSEIFFSVERIKDNNIDYCEMYKNIDNYIRKERDKKMIQAAMHQRFESILC